MNPHHDSADPGYLHRYAMVPGPGRFVARVHDNPAFIMGDPRLSHVRAAHSILGQLTVYEWAIPVSDSDSNAGVRIAAGKTIGFDVAVADADGQERGNWIAWTPSGSKGADDLGELTFVDGYEGLNVRSSQVIPPDLAVEPGVVTGRITNKGSGEPISNAWLKIIRDDRSSLDTYADGGGIYQQRVVPGTYDVEASARGTRQVVARRRVAVAAGEEITVDLSLEDLGTRFHVDDDADAGGDGSSERPFRTIQQALAATGYGDTLQLAPGTYSEPVELISGVTFIGAGLGQTRVTGEAHWGMALRPFITYYEPPGAELGLWRVALRDVAMEDFTLDGGDSYPPRHARDIAGVMALVMAVEQNDVAEVETLLADNPGLSTARFFSPDAHDGGSTALHRVGSVYSSATDAEYEIARLLIQHGADVNARGGQARGTGKTVLGDAGFFGNPRLTELYLAHGGDPDAEVMAGTAHEGSHVRNKSVYIPTFEALVEAGGQYDLGHLVMLHHTDRLIADLANDPNLVHQTVDLRHEAGESGTALHEAADDCYADIAALLLDRGADVNAVDNKGQTPLRRALSRECDGDIVQLLRDRGAASSRQIE